MVVGQNMTEQDVTTLGGDVRRELDQYPSFNLFKSAMRITDDLTDEEIGRKFLAWINQPSQGSGPTSQPSVRSDLTSLKF